jgi:NADH-quinone oxidoreductase subunit C
MEPNAADTSRADLIAAVAAIPGSAPVEERGGGLWVTATQLDVEAMARKMNALGYRLVTMTGLPLDDVETTIIYHYVQHHQAVNFKTSTRGGAIPSIALLVRPASWIEREIHDFFATNFVGHPNLVPLIRPQELKDGFFRDPDPASTDNR